MSVERARQRFASIIDKPYWPPIEKAYELAEDLDSESDREALDASCVALCQSLGVQIGPRICGSCEQPLPDPNGPDFETCADCVAQAKRWEFDEAEARAAHEALPQAEKDRIAERVAAHLRGMIDRVVQ